jgi:hypothetical protein
MDGFGSSVVEPCSSATTVLLHSAYDTVESRTHLFCASYPLI